MIDVNDYSLLAIFPIRVALILGAGFIKVNQQPVVNAAAGLTVFPRLPIAPGA